MRALKVFAIAVAAVLAASTAFCEPAFFSGNKLMTSISKGEVKKVESLLGERPFDEVTLGKALHTLLTLSKKDRLSERDTFRLTQILIAKGAFIDQTNVYGQTPLMIACEKNFETVAWTLLKAGANPFATDRFGLSPVEYAKSAEGDNETIVWLMEKSREDRATFRITNLRLMVKDSSVHVYYDLEGPFPAKIRLKAEGEGMKILPRHVSGDIGTKVVPGTNRKIVWAIEKDIPRGFSQREMVLDVVASAK